MISNRHNGEMKTFLRRETMKWVAIFALLVVAMLVLPTMVWADGCECPENTELVAEFEWDEDTGTYVFEKPAGNENVVIIAGDETGGTWTSTVGVSNVVLKGGPGCYTYKYGSAANSGSFSKSDLPDNPGGQKPDVSNVQFCKPKPTAVTLVRFNARPLKLPLLELLRRLWLW